MRAKQECTRVGILLALLLSAGGLGAQPPNDTCATAILITEGTWTGSNIGATTSSPALWGCGGCFPLLPCTTASDVWYLYVPSCSGTALASLCPADGGDTSFPAELFAFTGTCGSLAQIACAAYGGFQCMSQPNPLAHFPKPRLFFPVTAGVPVYLAVASQSQVMTYPPYTTGSFALAVSCIPAPPNDTCAGAIPVSSGANGPFSNLGAATSAVAASCGPGYQDVWFIWTATCTGITRVELGSSVHQVSVYDGCGGIERGCGPAEWMEFFALPGTTYVFRVASVQPATYGTFSLTITCPFELLLASPVGPGSLGMMTVHGTPGVPYFTAVTGHQGSYPWGWFYGVDMPLEDLFAELAWPGGFPFNGVLDASGNSPVLWIPSGVPGGLTFYAVSLELDPQTGLPQRATPARSFTTY